MDPLNALETTIDYAFSDVGLLTIALTHPSYVAEQPDALEDNQRLEFLGDAVLQLALTDILFRQYPEMKEGRLTKMRSALVKSETLAVLAHELRLGDFLRLGKGEEQDGGRERASNLADALEAVIAAVFLDGGVEPAMRFCRELCEELLQDPEAALARENPKGALQEYTQQHFQSSPVYSLVQVTGPEHLPEFLIEATAGGIVVQATAGSRKSAEKKAAQLALIRLLEKRGDNDAASV